MSFILRGPYPAMQTTTLMPSPKWGDSEGLTNTVQSMRAMDGTLYTYVTSRNGREKYRWDFEVSRHKALELREFINSYFGHLIQVTDHNDIVRIGYLRNNPFEFSGAGRAGSSWPGDETMSVTLEFEEQ